MTVKGLPPSTSHAELRQAGSALVEHKLVSRKQLDALFKNPTLTDDDRRKARKLIRHAHSEIQKHHVGRVGHRAVEAFEKAASSDGKPPQPGFLARVESALHRLVKPATEAATNEKAWGIATFATVLTTAILAPAVGPGVLLAEGLVGSLVGGIAGLFKR